MIDSSVMAGVILIGSGSAEASVRREDLAETLPLLAVETHKLHLLERHILTPCERQLCADCVEKLSR
jgi:hypothetical protein